MGTRVSRHSEVELCETQSQPLRTVCGRPLGVPRRSVPAQRFSLAFHHRGICLPAAPLAEGAPLGCA
eukprot:8854623-Pyramimonas_sp.AAC.1